MKTHAIFLGLALLGTAGWAQAAPDCTIRLGSNDQMQFSQKTLTVSAACESITLKLTHTGKLPVAAMGHNVVISRTADADAVARDGLKAGAVAGYLQAGDKRVLTATKMIGGGQTTSTTLAGTALKAGEDYSFFCSFPGHSMLMRGKLVVTP